MRNSLSLLPAALALAGAVGCGGIKHSLVVAPSWGAKSELDVAKLGSITSMEGVGGTLYVGMSKGVVALDASGKVLWAAELPPAMVRLVDADAKNVAWTAYDVTGMNTAEGLKAFFLGNLGNQPTYGNAQVGLLGAGGEAVWAVKSTEQTALSPPCLSPSAVGVSRGNTFAVFRRADGKEASSPLASAHGDLGGLSAGMIAQATRNRPVFHKNHFWAGFFAALAKYDESGKSLWNDTNFGLFSPFENITLGPVVFKDVLVFGTNPSGISAALPLVYGADDEPDKEFKESIDDQIGRVPGSYAANSTHFFVATNFHVVAYEADGDKEWDAANGGGGLYPGTHRGGRFVNDGFATRKSPGNLMVATDDRLYITSAYGKGDAITVLDARTGAYVESIDVDVPIIELAVAGKSLAVATFDSIRFLPL